MAADQRADPELAKIFSVLEGAATEMDLMDPSYKEAIRLAKHMAVEHGCLVRTILKTWVANTNDTKPKRYIVSHVRMLLGKLWFQHRDMRKSCACTTMTQWQHIQAQRQCLKP